MFDQLLSTVFLECLHATPADEEAAEAHSRRSEGEARAARTRTSHPDDAVPSMELRL